MPDVAQQHCRAYWSAHAAAFDEWDAAVNRAGRALEGEISRLRANPPFARAYTEARNRLCRRWFQRNPWPVRRAWNAFRAELGPAEERLQEALAPAETQRAKAISEATVRRDRRLGEAADAWNKASRRSEDGDA